MEDKEKGKKGGREGIFLEGVRDWRRGINASTSRRRGGGDVTPEITMRETVG